jgi:hypothetical protein
VHLWKHIYARIVQYCAGSAIISAMAKLLYRIGRSAYLNRWRFIAVWLLVLIGAGTAAATMMKPTSMTFTIPGLESVETQEEMSELFPDGGDDMEAPTGTVVVRAPEGGSLTDPATKADLDSLIADLQDQDALVDPESIVDPVTAAAGMEKQLTAAKAEQDLPKEQIQADLQALSPVSENERTGTFTVTFKGDTSQDVSPEDVTGVTDVLDDHATDNLEVSYNGNVFQMPEIGGTAELIGMAVAAIVLIITFGSFVAAGLPLLTAVVGVGTGMMLIYAGTALTDSINNMTPTLASMIGLAVGIDYALFIVSRFRNELVAFAGGNNMTPKELAQAIKKTTHRQRAHLAGLAVGKAGSAVCFAGLTVIIALTALSIINIPFLTAMALAAALTVFIAVIVAVTLLPAILGAFGTKSFAGRAPGGQGPGPRGREAHHGPEVGPPDPQAPAGLRPQLRAAARRPGDPGPGTAAGHAHRRLRQAGQPAAHRVRVGQRGLRAGPQRPHGRPGEDRRPGAGPHHLRHRGRGDQPGRGGRQRPGRAGLRGRHRRTGADHPDHRRHRRSHQRHPPVAPRRQGRLPPAHRRGVLGHRCHPDLRGHLRPTLRRAHPVRGDRRGPRPSSCWSWCSAPCGCR